jgi:hypothetical protein
MPGSRSWVFLGVFGWASLWQGRAGEAEAAAEVKLDKVFIAGIVEKLPPVRFEKAGQYHGTVQAFRLTAIEPRSRQLLVACQIDGVFHPPVSGPVTDRIARSPETPEGWRKFRFDVKARVNVEPGDDAAPRFRIVIDEVKRRQLEGFTGIVATVLGQFFDDLVTQIANGRASRLSDRLNAEILRRVTVFKEYGVFCGIEYAPTELVLHFDLTRLRSEGITGYVFAVAQPGTVPFYRWLHPRDGSHYYTIRPDSPDRPNSLNEGIACHVYDHRAPDTVPLYRWSNLRDNLYTTAPDGEHAARLGYRPRGIVCFIVHEPKPGTVPLYRFYDPARRHHFYTMHPYAEFAK